MVRLKFDPIQDATSEIPFEDPCDRSLSQFLKCRVLRRAYRIHHWRA